MKPSYQSARWFSYTQNQIRIRRGGRETGCPFAISRPRRWFIRLNPYSRRAVKNHVQEDYA
nr:MAG TPA: hypothetical protein [Caudoviricetes sp.]